MRVTGPFSTVVPTAPGAARRADRTAAFTLPEAEDPARPREAQAPRSAAPLDALIAVQAAGDALERRRRSVARSRNALDVLDDLKLGLLAGEISPATLLRLQHAIAELGERTGDERLDGLITDIELRARVELAKFEVNGR
jgi:hypothetical protein